MNNFEKRRSVISESISDKFIKDGLNGITEIWGLEVGLLLDDLYAGTADCVGEYESAQLYRFKTAKRLKKESGLKIIFYKVVHTNTHNVMFGTRLNKYYINGR